MKLKFMAALLAVCLVAAPSFGAEVKSKSGARAYVNSSAQAKFQKLVDWLDSKNYPIKFMGGIRHREGERCSTRSMHPCGKAIDINQTARGRVVAKFPQGTDAYARSLGIVPGSGWCNQDTGHFQIGGHDGCARYSKRNIIRRYAEAGAQNWQTSKTD